MTDGYDKLKPLGLPIHGAIDGFSRTDCGTENGVMAAIQLYLHQNPEAHKFRTFFQSENRKLVVPHVTWLYKLDY